MSFLKPEVKLGFRHYTTCLSIRRSVDQCQCLLQCECGGYGTGGDEWHERGIEWFRR